MEKTTIEKTDGKSKIEVATAKVLAGIGLIVVLFLLLSGAILLVKTAGSGLSAAVSLFTKNTNNTEETVVPETSVQNITTGSPFTLSWNHIKKAENGSYSLSYPCTGDLYFIVDTLDQGKKTVLCNQDFEFVNRGNALTITPYSASKNSFNVPLTIAFTPNGKNNPSISGVINAKITGTGITTTEAATTTTIVKEVIKVVEVPKYITVPTQSGAPIYSYPYTYQTYPSTSNSYTCGTYPYQSPCYGAPTTRPDNPYGLPDLRANTIEVGVLDVNNRFTRSDTLRRSDYKIGVRFRVENIGDKTSAPFRFNAYLPTYPAQTYNSDEQPGIPPGGFIEFTLGFDRAIEGFINVRILLDGGNYVTESNEGNNELNIPIRVL